MDRNKVLFSLAIILIAGLLVFMFYSAVSINRDIAGLNIDKGINPPRGNINANITIIEFSDFQCPNCYTAQLVLSRLFEDYNGSIVHYYRNLPLTIHENSMNAALAAEAANEQGKFWEYHDILFDNQYELDKDNLRKYALELGLNMTQFNSAFDSEKYKADIEKDKADAKALGVRGTPTFFINGQKVEGPDEERIRKIIEEELKK